jgi:hypothetical protein
MDSPHLVWLKKTGPLWLVMVTNVEEQTEESLYLSELSMHTPRISGDHILLITRNCHDGSELCSELNVLNKSTGVLTQLTYFGRDSLIDSPRIDGTRIAFRRASFSMLPVEEVYVGFEDARSPGWALAGANGLDGAANLALLLPPLAIAPFHRRLRRPRTTAYDPK